MQKLGGESSSVQKPIIDYSQQVGWEYVKPEDAIQLRGGEIGFTFKQTFVDQLLRLNPEFMTQDLAKELLKRFERTPPNIEGNLVIWEHLKGLRSVFVPQDNQERNVTFIDTENIDNNIFQVTEEFKFTNGNNTIRPDVVFLINGIPVFVIEAKAAHKIDGISMALDQIKRYHRECPELFTILQIYSLTHLLKYYYSATWNTSGKWLFNWKEEIEKEIKTLKEKFEFIIKSFFDKERVCKVLTEFIMFTRQDDELIKVVLRPHQMRAVDKVIERALEPKKRGLIWHTQGSGKTFTMIVAAQRIIENTVFQNPTVIMLVDRNELETQLFGNISAVGIENVEIAGSKRHLRELLKSDKRGLIVSMIHKFDDIPADINTRDNIFVLVDEAHRTTGGKLGTFLMAALPNATLIGFTGTPIDRKGQGSGTFITFGTDDPPQGYLDKYSIGESIEDGTTVQLHYTLAENDLLVDRDTLEKEFLDLAEVEGISDVEELNKVLDKAVNLRNMMKKPDRIERVAKYFAKHYKENVEPLGYKAFFVAVDREACALYKNEIDKHFPEDRSRVVYSKGQNDNEILAKYHLSEEEEKRVRKAFRDPEQSPKILIVTEKLLTGFDAPILYCMYLDKPMRDHVLLQAIARVNRPYENAEGRKKPSGFVLDFVGIFDKLEKALAFDSSDIKGIVHDIKKLKVRFVEMIRTAKEKYLAIIHGRARDKAVEAVLEHFIDDDVRHEFYKFFKDITEVYDIISPDAFLRPYLDDIEAITRMYKIVKGYYEPGVDVSKEFSKKTEELVKEHTKSGEILPPIEIYEINENTLRIIEEKIPTDTEKVFNLLRSIINTVDKDSLREPYLRSIGEKAEIIAKMFQQRQRDTKETLDELKKIIDEINTARKEQEEKGMPTEIFTIYWLLKTESIEEPEGKANKILPVIEKYPHWKTNAEHERLVRSELYDILLSTGSSDIEKISEFVKNIIRIIKREAE